MSNTDKENTECCADGNCGEPEVIYSNDTYRVEKVGISDGENTVYQYAVIHNIYNVMEVESLILAQALNTCDELESAVNTFFQGKAFEVP